MRPRIVPWLLRCGSCSFERSTLAQGGPAARTAEAIDEGARAEALQALRRRNFQTIVAQMSRLRPRRGRLLDVGCAHGWFLQAAAQEGWQGVGIEPDDAMAQLARQSGQEVRAGTFPQALVAGEKFDAISFNDVLEHLPDVQAALKAARDHLQAGGLLVINLPDARGPFYRAALLLARAGIRAPLERLWQKDFPSPHLSYFKAPLLRTLAQRLGLQPVYSSRLPSVALRGLWSRLRYDKSASAIGSGAAFAATCALLPFLRALPSDISLEIFEKTGA